MGPGKDTHGTPVPTKWRGRGWPKPHHKKTNTRGFPSSTLSTEVKVAKAFHVVFNEAFVIFTPSLLLFILCGANFKA